MPIEPCKCGRFRPGSAYDLGQCRRCWKQAHPAAASAPPLDAAPCRFEGEPLTGRERAAAGLDHAKQWLHCLNPAKPLGPVVCPCKGCGRGCAGYLADAPFPPVARRHLLYHILPVAGNGVWQRGVDQLRLRWPLFTGRKLVAVMTGGPLTSQGDPRDKSAPRPLLALDTPDQVRRYLPADCEVFEFPNDPSRWEGVSWPVLWGRLLAQADPDDAVLYAHAKGVTRPASPGDACQMWASFLYNLALDYWPHVEEAMRYHPVAGPFFKDGAFFGPPNQGSRWHYSGNFWWARVSAMRGRWPRVPLPADRWATEGWVGTAFTAAEAGKVGPLQELPGNAIDFYSSAWINSTAVPAMARWQAMNPPTPAAHVLPKPPTPGKFTLTVVVPTTGRPTIGRTLDSITSQLEPGDQLIVLSDRTGDWGATPRTVGQQMAKGSHILWMDDDDHYLPGSFARIRRAVRDNPGRPILFRFRREPVGDVLWRDPVVRVANVSTQMFCAPNDPNRLGIWGTRYEGDYDFIASTCAMYPEGPAFVDEVISVWRPSAPRKPTPGLPGPPPWWSHDPDSFDPHCWGEVVELDEYGLDAIDLRGATVLDVGAHVGCFAWACVVRGAALVHAYEPEPRSAEHLERNARRMTPVWAHRMAVGEMVGPWFRSGGAVEREPPSWSLDRAIVYATTSDHDDLPEMISPSGRIELLKIDTEGGEWPALSQVKDLSKVDRVVGEWHAVEWGGRTWGPDDLARLLEPHGFRVELFGPPKGRPAPDRTGLFCAVRG